jgi:hypothetical protein
MSRQRMIAKITGYSLVLMALIAGFSLGFAYPKFINPNQLEFANIKLTENLELYKLMLSGILFIIILDILVSWTLFQYFKKDSGKYALLSFISRMIYTLIFCIATYFLAKNIEQSDNEIVLHNYNLFQIIWSVGLIIFGIHLVIVGVLVKLHKSIPGILWYLTIIAGFSYIVVHILKISCPDLTDFTITLNNILTLPMALGELGLALWLIIKGGKIEKNENTYR